MASSTEICNSALIKLGVEPIASLTEDSKPASLCNRQYARLRDKLLQSHYWNFAMARNELAVVSITPSFGFQFVYQLPSNCLRALHLQNKSARFKVEQNRYLHTNVSGAKLLYIVKEEDVSKFSPMFQELLSYDIAIDLCMVLTQKRTLKADLIAERKELLRDTRSIDGQEGFMDSIIEDTWINSRNTGIDGEYWESESI